MSTFALLDVVSPYVLGGAAISDPWHELLSALFVTQMETAFDDNGVCISGIARFSADIQLNPPIYTPPASLSWSGTVNVDHRTARTQGAYWDFPDIAITFRLTAPRQSSPVADAVLPGLTNGAAGTLLAGLGQGQPAAGQPAADAPGTVFHLDLLIDAATLHLPFLTGAKLNANGTLAVDPANPDVTVTLPKVKLSLEQTAGSTAGGGTDPVMTLGLDSWAAEDIDDPAGSGYGELLAMHPPYALFGPGNTLGFGFNSLILDMSGTSTPPEILEKFGVGDDFRGFYAPDVRFFFAIGSTDDDTGEKNLWEVDISARELLIGWGPEGGISGIFGVDVVHPDSPQTVNITIYDEFGGLNTKLRLPDVADPASPAPPYPFPLVTAIPAKTQWVVDVSGGQPPYNISVDGQVQTTAPIVVTFPPGVTDKTVEVDVADVHSPGNARKAFIPLTLAAQSLTAPDGGTSSPAQDASITQVTAGPPGYTITMVDAKTAEQVTLVFTPPDATATMTPQGGAPQVLALSNGQVKVPLAHGASIDVSATWTVPGTPPSPVTFAAQFAYDQPKSNPNKVPDDPDDATWAEFAANPGNIRTTPSNDTSDPMQSWPTADDFLVNSSAFAAFVDAAKQAPGTGIALTGMASKEHAPNEAYNVALSQRRIWALEALFASNGVTNATNPFTTAAEGEQPPAGSYLQDGRGAYRRVSASINTPGRPGGTNTAGVRIARPAKPPVPPKKIPPVIPRKPPSPDKWRLKEVHARVEFDHNRLIAAELKLKVDVATALESYLATVQQNNSVPADAQGSTKLPVGTKADPNDGVMDVRIQLTLDDTVGRWQIVASLFENDPDGLLQTPPPTAIAQGTASEAWWRDFFGVMIAITPLLDASASSNTAAGDIAALAVAAAIPLLAVATGAVHVPRITLFGGELTIGHDPAGTRFALLLDVEVALVIQVEVGSTKLIDTDPKNPITVRYKAVGFTTSDDPQTRDLVPVFDSSKGYTINIPSSGGIKVPDPLGDILQVAGTRIARSNPTNIELDLELKADLGVVSVDKTTIRIPLDGGHAPTISALGVHVDITGAIEGSGYLAIYPDGFGGQLDVSLPGLGVRIAAGLAVRHVVDPNDASHTATAVLVTLEVDFPVPIALGSSGLGIYGFGGLFALHYRRDEHPGDPVPALDWLTRVNGNPMDITGWTPQIDDWAIGLGAVLGTVDAGFTLNVKGMLILEMPGPRILMVMKAKVLWIRPPREGNPTATILAVIDVDLGRGRITIGITLDYDIKPLLAIHIPVRAIFPFDDLPHFAIDAGTWYAPATVTFFDLFKASGYFMIRGKGIPDTGSPTDNYDAGHDTDFPLLPQRLGGFAIATGVSVSFTWGSRPSGLYLAVGAAIDVGLGFSPILFAGKLRVWGELHLWVVGIEASAQLTVTAGQVPDGPPVHDPEYPGDPTHMIQPTKNLVLIDGEVHGEIDMFFFTISGSVHVTLGDSPGSPPEPPPLITGVSLQSRAAALLAGLNSDRPIDGKVADAHSDGAAIPDGEAVPIDSIIVVHFDCTPRVAGGAAVTSSQPAGALSIPIGIPDGPAAPAVQRGEPFYAYRIKTINLDNGLTDGEAPIVWWPNQPNPGSETKRELALLTRVPDPHPSAVERSKHAEDLLHEHWDHVCDPVAPATSVLWTFHEEALGPSSVGWMLFGTAWPDPAGSTRHSAPNLELDVAEPWRAGGSQAGFVTDIAPARVLGGLVACPDGCDQRTAGSVLVGRPLVAPALSRLLMRPSWSLHDVLTTPQEELAAITGVAVGRLAESQRAAARGCFARVLEAPFRRPLASDPMAENPLGTMLAELMADAAAQATDELDDAITFRTKEIVSCRLLLLVPAMVLRTGSLRLRAFGRDGELIDEWKIDGANDPSRTVSNRDDLPKTWIDPDGPWHCRVDEVFEYFDALRRTGENRGFAAVLVDASVPDGTYYLQLGIADVDRLMGEGFTRPSFLTGIVETLTAAEVEREDIETAISSHKVDELNGALAGIHNPPALLLPGKEYTLEVEWEYAKCDGDGSNAGAWTAESQRFRFRTDNQPLMARPLPTPDGQGPQSLPVRLDPWVLLTDPDAGEHFRFHGPSIKVVFSVDYLLKMFETYGVTLQAKVRSASYKNSDPASPNFSKTFAGLSGANTKLLPGPSVLTPWEDMVRDVVSSKACIDSSGDVYRHTILDVNLLLEPRTDYILDIEDANAAPPPAGGLATPLFRRAFTTSRYADASEMCADVGKAAMLEYPASAADIDELLALGSASLPISAAALDSALRKAGLRPVVDVPEPVFEVLWVTSGGSLQPRIIVIRTPEPLARTRKEPESYSPPGQPRLQREVITLVDKPYLEVIQTSGVADAPSMQIVTQPGMNTVILLINNGRNAPIDLSLRQHDNAFLGEGSGVTDIELLRFTLDAATWEVV